MAKTETGIQIHVSGLIPNQRTVEFDGRIIGTLLPSQTEGKWQISRLRLPENDDAGRGVYVKPSGKLTRPFGSTLEAAGAVLTHWKDVNSNDR